MRFQVAGLNLAVDETAADSQDPCGLPQARAQRRQRCFGEGEHVRLEVDEALTTYQHISPLSNFYYQVGPPHQPMIRTCSSASMVASQVSIPRQSRGL